MISYEVAISLILLLVILLSGSLNLAKIVTAQALTTWFFFPLLPIGGLFLIAMLAETNRTPFDLPEAEAELVSGFNVEYSSILFAMFSLAEYNSMLLMSTLYVILFLGGWSNGILIFLIKILFIAFSIVKVRAALPRYRYDQLMFLCWYIFLPLSLGIFIFYFGLSCYFEINRYSAFELYLEISKKYKYLIYNL